MGGKAVIVLFIGTALFHNFALRSIWGKVNDGLWVNPSFLLLLEVCAAPAIFSTFLSFRSFSTHFPCRPFLLNHACVCFFLSVTFIFVYSLRFIRYHTYMHMLYACAYRALYATHLDAKCSSHIQISMCLTVIDLDNNAKKESYMQFHAMHFLRVSQYNVCRYVYKWVKVHTWMDLLCDVHKIKFETKNIYRRKHCSCMLSFILYSIVSEDKCVLGFNLKSL